MLVITRRAGESFLIGEDVTVTILKSSNGSVRLGINAPKEVDIFRKELVENSGGFIPEQERKIA